MPCLIPSRGFWAVLLLAAMTGSIPSTAHAQLRAEKEELIKVNDRVYVAVGYSLGNIIFVVTDTSLVVVDTSESPSAATKALAEIRKVSELPISYIIYTHFHGDHVNGARVLAGKGTKIIAQQEHAKEMARYRLLLGYNARLNTIQFGAELPPEKRGAKLDIDPRRPVLGYVEPDITFDQSYRFEEGGVQFELFHTIGETYDHLMVWLPQSKTLMPGDLFYPSFPMLASPMKHDRPVLSWAASLDEMRKLHPEYLVPSHNTPYHGEKEIDEMLANYAAAIRSVHDQTIKMLNKGLPLEIIRERVQLPPELASLPYLRPLYGGVAWSVNGIYRQYTGWYDMQPAHLNPGPSKRVSDALVEAAGGPEKILEQAQKALAEDPQLVVELTDVLVSHDPESKPAHELRAAALEKLADAATNTVEINVYRTAAQESRKKAGLE